MENEAFYPQNLNQLLEILSESNGTIYAGGTDLMVEKRRGKALAADLTLPIIHIKDVPELNKIEIKDGYIEIGACSSYSTLLESEIIPQILKDAIITIGGPAVRNFGTIGGNICNASPAADCIPPLAVLDARLLLESKTDLKGNINKREISLDDFILGRKKVDLKKGEVLTKIKIPEKYLYDIIYSKFEKVGLRNAMTLSKVSVSILATKQKDIHISFGATAPKFVRIIENEKKITKKKVNFEIFKKLYEPYFSAIDDQRSTKEYRENIALILGYKLYNEAFEAVYKNK
ncbi:MAG: FAD binding domain-containing protein [Exilispira sp.]|jgi:CO/xanthine dehydrogenase FAD-binding subunit|nr:FAD binding domain-containing protein [Exilispira sp.]